MSTVLYWALAAGVASAAPTEPLTLDWSGPPECPDRATVHREVLRLAQLTAVSLHHVAATARVQRQGARYHLSLKAELDGVSGQREFEGQSCDSVADAAVLTLALMLNPDAQIDRVAPPAASEPAPPARVEPVLVHEAPPPPVAASPDSAASDSSPWPTHVAGGVMGGLRTGVLPDVGVELGVGARVLTGPLSLMLAASAMPPQSAPAPESLDARAELWLLSLGALAGWHTRFEPFGFGMSAGVDWTRASGRGDGVSEPEQAHIHWLSAQFGGTAMLAVTEHVDLGTGVFGLVPLARPAFTFEEIGTVYRPEPLGIRAYFSVIVTLL